MATVLNSDEKENDPSVSNQGSVIPVVGGGGVHLSPQGGNISGQGGGGTGGERSGTGQAGGQFATLNDYVNANTPNAGKLANQVIQPIQGQYDQAQKDIASTEANINQQIAGGYTPFKDYGQQLQGGNISQFASDPNNVKAFQGQLNDVYKGPGSAEGTSDYQKLLGSLNTQLTSGQAQTGSTAGQAQLLKGIQTQVPNNQGVTALNEAILSKSPDYQSRVTSAYEPFKGLISGLQEFAPGANQAIAQGQQEAAKASSTANQQIKEATDAANKQAQDELTKAQNATNQYNQNIGTYGEAANKVNADIQNFLAGNSHVSVPKGSAPLAPWLNLQAIEQAPNINTAATPQDFATAKAIQALNPNAQMTLDQANAGQAGQFKLPTLPGGDVTSALNQELGGIRNQITGAYQPFENAKNKEAQLTSQADAMKAQNQKAKEQLGILGIQPPQLVGGRNQNFTTKNGDVISPDGKVLSGKPTADQIAAVKNYQSGNQNQQALYNQAAGEGGTMASLAPGLQWLQGTGNAYNQLLNQVNGALAPVNAMNVPAPQQGGNGSNILGQVAQGVGETNPMLGQFIQPIQQVGNQITGQSPMDLIKSGALNMADLGIPTSILSNLGGDIKNALGGFGNLIKGLF